LKSEGEEREKRTQRLREERVYKRAQKKEKRKKEKREKKEKQRLKYYISARFGELAMLLQPMEKFSSSYIFQHHVELVTSLEGKSQVDQERMLDVLQNISLSLCVDKLISLN
jgi:hypothetical protein